MGVSLEELIEDKELDSQVHVVVGAELLVRIEGVEEKLKSTFVGYSGTDFLVIRTPRLNRIRSKLFAGNRVSVHYLDSGTVVGFQSNLVDHIVTPFPLMFLSYPIFVSRRSLRSKPWAQCCAPANLKFEGQDFPGLIVNISSGGCRFTSRMLKEAKTPKPGVGHEVVLSFYLTKELGTITFPATIRSKTSAQDVTVMGLQFDVAPGKETELIEKFVNYILAHRVAELHALEP